MSRKKILGASIGNCVHVAGIIHFLQLAEQEGYDGVFLGPAVALDNLFANINSLRPDIVAVSYRLTPENAHGLLNEIAARRATLSYDPVWVFGGTKPVARIAAKLKMFAHISDGMDDINDSIRFLRGDDRRVGKSRYGRTITERIMEEYPYPVLRHHFGLPTVEETAKGIEKIAKAKVLDIVSLGPDQNAQQFFFQPHKIQRRFDGAGGVPVRTKDDLVRLKQASQYGNFPLMRCYSGTEDVFLFADMLAETIQNAWAAIPLCWYNELDGRGSRTIEESIVQAQALIQWHAQRCIPVEINEPHHWGLRDAHDVIPVAMAYISAYNAKKLGVQNYIAQYMFNNPYGLSFSMDFARVLAMVEMTESLQDEHFAVYRQTRTGLPLFSSEMDIAKGQLAASTFMQMAIKPHIVHVVAYCEADHAATAADVITSCRIVKGVIKQTLNEQFSIEKDERIQARKEHLIEEAWVLLNFIREYFTDYDDPIANPQVLAESIRLGFIDAVHIMKNDKFKGTLVTKFVNGKCEAFNKQTGEMLSEAERLQQLVPTGARR